MDATADDSDVTDNDSDDDDDDASTADPADAAWVVEDWPEDEVPEAQPAPPPPPAPIQLTVQQHLEALRSKDVNNFVDLFCFYCFTKPVTLRVLSCQHVMCGACILRLPEVPHPVHGERVQVRHCPDCRSIIASSTPVLTGAFRLAWRADLETGFGTANMAHDHAQDGRRPADETIDEQLEEMSRQFAQSLQGTLFLSTTAFSVYPTASRFGNNLCSSHTLFLALVMILSDPNTFEII